MMMDLAICSLITPRVRSPFYTNAYTSMHHVFQSKHVLYILYNLFAGLQPHFTHSYTPTLLALLKPRNVSNDYGLPNEYFPVEIKDISSADPRVVFCPIDFPTYHENPSRYPMFRNLETISCNGKTITYAEGVFAYTARDRKR